MELERTNCPNCGGGLRLTEDKRKLKCDWCGTEIAIRQEVEVREIQKMETVSEVVYVNDNENYRIQKFTSEGKFITKWGRKGSRDGEFEYDMHIAISKN